MKLKELIQDNTVKFVRFKEGNFIYSIKGANGDFEFPVPLNDIGGAELKSEDKAIYFLRYIRKHLETLY